MVYTQETFIKRANEPHNGQYDYSKTEYVDGRTKILIICPKHGEFMQSPSGHLRGNGCRRCGLERRKQTNLAKYGAVSWAASKDAKALAAKGKGPWSKKSRQKVADTCQERFGAKTWAESDEGRSTLKEMCADEDVRQEMSKRARSQEAREHYAETSMRNHGAGHWTQSDDGKAKLHAMFSTAEERAARSNRMLSPEVKAKIRATSIERYGVPYYWQSEEGKVRLHELLNREEVQQKIIATKKKRGTINSSKPERMAYQMLVERFGEADIESQYKTDSRYPYACDFYVKSLDLFIELNASWLHCGHWFDENSEDDLCRLEVLMDKASTGKPMYRRAIYIWTYDDLKKRKTAVENNLNYLVFWDNDLKDFKEWLEAL